MIGAIKFAKYYELGEDDWVVTVFTDSMDLYLSRVQELAAERGEYSEVSAARDHQTLMDAGLEHMLELGYYDRKRIHNLKYFTWIEQQGREVSELNAQWHDHQKYWNGIFSLDSEIDGLIEEFNEMIEKG